MVGQRVVDVHRGTIGKINVEGRGCMYYNSIVGRKNAVLEQSMM